MPKSWLHAATVAVAATLCSVRKTGRRIAYEYAMTAIVPR